MNFYAITVLAFGMSMDAFAASLGKGATLHRPPFSEALRTGLIFGIIEAITPVIGWGVGMVASQYIMAWDHWIAFLLLLILGFRMVKGGLSKTDNDIANAPQRHGFWLLVTTAIATSLDAMAVGVSLAFLNVSIIVTALMIGLATTLMTTTGMLLGRFIGVAFGKWAEVMGGVVLAGIGGTILVEHLGLLNGGI